MIIIYSDKTDPQSLVHKRLGLLIHNQLPVNANEKLLEEMNSKIDNLLQKSQVEKQREFLSSVTGSNRVRMISFFF